MQISTSANQHTHPFDYIITGCGCAGLSLLYRMMQHSFFDDKKILVADQSQKKINDKTWCFWEKENGLFESIVHHRWKEIDFYSDDFSARFDLVPYEYKMIRSIDLYDLVINIAKQKKNIVFKNGSVENILNENNKGCAIIDGEKFYAQYIFNSILFNKNFKGRYNLLQHFKGLLIETEENIFDEAIATFMDFRVAQNAGTTFVYVLPVSKNKALVEYTLFSEEILPKEKYDEALKNYIHKYLTAKNYSVIEEEYGIIPMTDHRFSKGAESIVNIGTAGNQTKASSGFTFQFIQKNSDKIIDAILHNKDLHNLQPLAEKRFHLYDHVLLNILSNKKMSGEKIFSELFKNNSPQTVLQFLDNESSFAEELKIMQSMPAHIFLTAVLKELFHF